jgi:Leucine-rich repeat (LRR) protein
MLLSFSISKGPNEIKADDRLCGQDFAGLVSLKMLTIIGCTNFNEIKQGFFECMPNLQSICLEHCPIDSIQPGAFICVPEIKRLEIKNCDLLKECVSLSELTKLEMLDLSGNKIMSLNKLSADLDHLRSMNTSLKVLSLENNQLSSLDAGAFARLSALTVLDLTCNHIKTIEPGAFSGLVNLRELFLNKNSLNEPFDLSLVFDPDLINLKAVDLRCTRISRINLGWPYVYFQAVTMSGDVKNKFTRFKYNISLYLDSSYLLSGGEILTELSEKGLILLNKESIKFLSYF